ncbi:universal stress protein [Larkinella bovis]|uniref:Universal stress protein n=1 Tax=Larkinella bovis TaxID=683041 RepID=A0ABW0IE77_9BACT
MKAIVLATDFSENARSASEFAGQLAAQHNARLILLHVYQHPLQLELLRTVFTPMEEKVKRSARRKLYRLRDKLQQVAGGQLSITVLAREGATLETIERVVNEEKADLLVMGTAGARSAGVRYFGSQATDMIPRTTVSLLLVPPGAKFVPFKNIVLAVNLEKPVSAHALDGVMRFAKRFEGCLNLICVSQKPGDPLVQQAAEELRQLLKHQPHTVSLVPGEDLTTTILHFVAENRADLVMMLPKSRNRILRSLLETRTQRLARQSDVPVLAVV